MAVITVRTSAEIRNAAKSKLAAIGSGFQEYLERKLIEFISGAQNGNAATTNSGNQQPARHGESPLTDMGKAQSLPAKDHAAAIGQLPDEVISFVQKHWADPNCRECVLAIARIWDVGDPEIMDAIARNCKTFARSSDMLEALSESVEHEKVPPEYARRAKELLSGSYRRPQKDRNAKVSTRNRAGGRP